MEYRKSLLAFFPRRGSRRALLTASARLPVRALIAGVKAYRLLISPLFPPCCRYDPTCSEYAIEALRRHGAARGSALCLARLLRCHPFAAGGFDPVPEPPSSSGASPSASSLSRCGCAQARLSKGDEGARRRIDE